MMQRHSKYIAGALLLGLMLPSLSFAAERGALMEAREQRASNTPRMASGTPRATENFCTRLDANIAKLEQKVGEREGKLGEKRTERQAAELDEYNQ
jgi:uncharacterized protein with von Willebrand factor type A (vWA) domain